ncbi:MAG: hypothetical protein LW823_02140 [Rickettsiales bacterium]|jgi:hypothetical protein|nr:hypothetical protein [Rickettsiales bacterium]
MVRNNTSIKKYAKCGQMPLYLIQLGDGHISENCLLLCKASRFKQIIKNKQLPTRITDYGKVIYRSSGVMSDEIIKALLKDRYDINLDDVATAGPRIFF